MLRYHFHTRDGIDHSDPEGTELSGVPEARAAAASLFGKLLKDETETFWKHQDWEMTVTDDRGMILFQLHLSANDAPALGEGRRNA